MSALVHEKNIYMLLILIFLTSLLVVAFAIPPIILLAFEKRLFDDPTESRKVHQHIVPNLGGVAIFTGFLFSACLFIPPTLLPQANILMAAGLILFMTGLKDDMIGLSPLKKFSAQTVSAAIIAFIANIRIKDLHGLLGIETLNEYASIVFTIIFIVAIINAFNLIDGIDGLAASLGIMLSLTYAFIFFQSGEIGWAYLSISLTGALVGFLFFNITPARIFMGDSGSLLLGFIAAVLSIKFINLAAISQLNFGLIPITSSLSVVFAILIIPIFDTTRVFTLRILKGNSPFVADSNHTHHRLLDLGLSHMQSTLVLTLINVMFVVMAIFFQRLGDVLLLPLIAGAVLVSNFALTIYVWRVRNKPAKPTFHLKKEKTFGEKVLEFTSEN